MQPTPSESAVAATGTHRAVRVLVAEDEIVTRARICSLLEQEGYETLAAGNGRDAIELARRHRPDLILLDVVMPEVDGFSALREIKDDEHLRDTPVFMLTARDAPRERVMGLDMGASDYVLKPFSPDELMCRMRLALKVSGERREVFTRLKQLEDLNQRLRQVEGGRESGAEDPSGPVEVLDHNTDLPSLTTFPPQLEDIFEFASDVAVLYVNLSKCDIIETKYGGEKCDHILRDVTRFVDEFLQTAEVGAEGVVVTRCGGDDFVVFLAGLDREREAHIDKLKSALEEHLSRRTKETCGEDIATVLEFFVGHAIVERDRKVRTKRLIHRGVKRAQSDATDIVKHDLDRKKSLLRRCLRERRLHTTYQPILAVGRGEPHRVLGYEVLTRGEIEGFTNPQVLYEVAEQSGLVWELSRIIRRLAIEPMTYLAQGELLFINMHPADFSDPHFLGSEIWDDRFGSVSRRIVFEITERAAIHDFDLFKDYLAPLREQGYRIALDDLGSGYSGLTSLAMLEPDFIKFDMALIRDIDKHQVKQNLVRTMIAFAEDSGASVVAEGVETRAEALTLMELGCHSLQGYYFARPARQFPPVRVDLPELPVAVPRAARG
jgi:EAL domain-containing protein (putative c-di-GMP-specific phosphodiesterase class I)/DNA-binding NarL/FixJ family response regulator